VASEAEDARAAARRIVQQVLADRGEQGLADRWEPVLTDAGAPLLTGQESVPSSEVDATPLAVGLEAAREELLFAGREPSDPRSRARDLLADALPAPEPGSAGHDTAAVPGDLEADPSETIAPPPIQDDAEVPGTDDPVPTPVGIAPAVAEEVEVPASRLRARELVAAVLAEADERDRQARREVEEAAARAERDAAEAEARETERQRAEAERAEAERLEAERAEAERLEAERLEAERAEAERLDAERAEAERLDAERAEAERLDAERAEAERLDAERAEAERLAVERADVAAPDEDGGAAERPRDPATERTAPLSVSELAAAERTSPLPAVDGPGPSSTVALPAVSGDADPGGRDGDVPTRVIGRSDAPAPPDVGATADAPTPDAERPPRAADPSSARSSLPAVTSSDRSAPRAGDEVDGSQREDRSARSDHASGGVLEATVDVPPHTDPPRGGRWLVASIIGAILLAVLFPLAVDALRTLVEL
jgi:hypothetical protein